MAIEGRSRWRNDLQLPWTIGSISMRNPSVASELGAERARNRLACFCSGQYFPAITGPGGFVLFGVPERDKASFTRDNSILSRLKLTPRFGTVRLLNGT